MSIHLSCNYSKFNVNHVMFTAQKDKERQASFKHVDSGSFIVQVDNLLFYAVSGGSRTGSVTPLVSPSVARAAARLGSRYRGWVR